MYCNIAIIGFTGIEYTLDTCTYSSTHVYCGSMLLEYVPVHVYRYRYRGIEYIIDVAGPYCNNMDTRVRTRVPLEHYHGLHVYSTGTPYR